MNRAAKKPVDNPEVRVEMVEVSPEVAEGWLGATTYPNRPLRPGTIEAYAADMLSGDWRQNGETIKFNSDGGLLDGQHRLRAIVQSGTTQRMLAVFGLPGNTFETVDTGTRRTFGQTLKHRDERSYNALAAVTRRCYLWDRGMRGFRLQNPGVQPTHIQMLTWLKKNSGVRESVQLTESTRRQFKPIPASILGMCHWVISRDVADAEEDCEYFFARLGDGADLGRDHAVYVLRKRASDLYGGETRTSTGQLTAYVIKAWNAFREGVSNPPLTYRPGGKNPEKFPEPR